MHVLKGDAAVSPRRLKAKRYLNSALLVIDEVGFRPLDRQEANLFFRLVSARYEKGSIILTSNKHVRDWPEIFAGDEILTTALNRPAAAPLPQRQHPGRQLPHEAAHRSPRLPNNPATTEVEASP